MLRLDPDLLSAECVVKGVRIRPTDETKPGHDFKGSVPHQLVVPSRLAKCASGGANHRFSITDAIFIATWCE
jgi:hypothetical protein